MSFNDNMPTVIVTGCAGGIGRAVCELYQTKGYRTVGIDRVECEIDGVATHIVDLGDPDQVAKFCSTFQSVDAVINVAALQICKPFWELSTLEWDRTYNVNVRAIWLMCKHLRDALSQASGCVVNIASVHAQATSDKISAYGSSKAAVVGLTRNLAIEMAPFGIRVVSISPGAIDTPMLREGMQRGVTEEVSFEELWTKFNQKHMLGRVGRPDEVASMCYTVMQNAFLTGTNVVVDGGVLCRLSTE